MEIQQGETHVFGLWSLVSGVGCQVLRFRLISFFTFHFSISNFRFFFILSPPSLPAYFPSAHCSPLTAHGQGITLGFWVVAGLTGSLAGAGSFFADFTLPSCSLSSLVGLLTVLFCLGTTPLNLVAVAR